jgi:hypothetical protein
MEKGVGKATWAMAVIRHFGCATIYGDATN